MFYALLLILVLFLIHHFRRMRYWIFMATILGNRFPDFATNRFKTEILTIQHWFGLIICSLGALVLPFFPLPTLIIGIIAWQLTFSPFRNFKSLKKRTYNSAQKSTFIFLLIISILWISFLGFWAFQRSDGLMWGIFLLGLLILDVLLPYFAFRLTKKW